MTPREYQQQRQQKQWQERETLRQEKLAQIITTIQQIAPTLPAIDQVYLFGSVVQPGRFSPRSDIDVAVECHHLTSESDFWRLLEQKMNWPIDVRPYVGPIILSVAAHGQKVYERTSPHSATSD